MAAVAPFAFAFLFQEYVGKIIKGVLIHAMGNSIIYKIYKMTYCWNGVVLVSRLRIKYLDCFAAPHFTKDLRSVAALCLASLKKETGINSAFQYLKSDRCCRVVRAESKGIGFVILIAHIDNRVVVSQAKEPTESVMSAL